MIYSRNYIAALIEEALTEGAADERQACEQVGELLALAPEVVRQALSPIEEESQCF